MRLLSLSFILLWAQASLAPGESPRGTQQPQRVVIQLKATLSGHAKQIEQIAFSPDGELIGTSSDDGTVRLWNALTGELKDVLAGARKVEWEDKLWFLEGGKQFSATHDFPGSFTGELQMALAAGEDKLAISPDKQIILTARRENSSKVFGRQDLLTFWDLATGRSLVSVEEVPDGVSQVYWSPDGKRMILVGSGRSKARLVTVADGRVKAKLSYGSCAYDRLFGSNGCEPFFWNADSTVFLKQKTPLKLWSADFGELLTTIQSVNLPAVFSPTDQKLLVTRGKDKRTALLWEITLK
jgi:WD40 repeat protein